jgi:hypothetical protein
VCSLNAANPSGGAGNLILPLGSSPASAKLNRVSTVLFAVDVVLVAAAIPLYIFVFPAGIVAIFLTISVLISAVVVKVVGLQAARHEAEVVAEIRRKAPELVLPDEVGLDVALAEAFVFAADRNNDDALLSDFVDIFQAEYPNGCPWSDEIWLRVLFLNKQGEFRSGRQLDWVMREGAENFREIVRNALLQGEILQKVPFSRENADVCAEAIMIIFGKDIRFNKEALKRLLKIAADSGNEVLLQQSLCALFKYRNWLGEGEILEVLAQKISGLNGAYANMVSYLFSVDQFSMAGNGSDRVKFSVDYRSFCLDINWCAVNDKTREYLRQFFLPDPAGLGDGLWWFCLNSDEQQKAIVEILIKHNLIVDAVCWNGAYDSDGIGSDFDGIIHCVNLMDFEQCVVPAIDQLLAAAIKAGNKRFMEKVVDFLCHHILHTNNHLGNNRLWRLVKFAAKTLPSGSQLPNVAALIDDDLVFKKMSRVDPAIIKELLFPREGAEWWRSRLGDKGICYLLAKDPETFAKVLFCGEGGAVSGVFNEVIGTFLFQDATAQDFEQFLEAVCNFSEPRRLKILPLLLEAYSIFHKKCAVRGEMPCLRWVLEFSAFNEDAGKELESCDRCHLGESFYKVSEAMAMRSKSLKILGENNAHRAIASFYKYGMPYFLEWINNRKLLGEDIVNEKAAMVGHISQLAAAVVGRDAAAVGQEAFEMLIEELSALCEGGSDCALIQAWRALNSQICTVGHRGAFMAMAQLLSCPILAMPKYPNMAAFIATTFREDESLAPFFYGEVLGYCDEVLVLWDEIDAAVRNEILFPNGNSWWNELESFQGRAGSIVGRMLLKTREIEGMFFPGGDDAVDEKLLRKFTKGNASVIADFLGVITKFQEGRLQKILPKINFGSKD